MKRSKMTHRQVVDGFREFWEACCCLNPDLLTDKPAMLQEFVAYVDGLHRDGWISDRVAERVTIIK